MPARKKMGALSKKLKAHYSKKYPMNETSKGDKFKNFDALKYIVNYQREVLDTIENTYKLNGKHNGSYLQISSYGVCTVEEEMKELKNFSHEDNTFDLVYIEYTLYSTLTKMTSKYKKEFFLYHFDDKGRFSVKGGQYYLIPVVSDPIMKAAPDGSKVFVKFKREKMNIFSKRLLVEVDGNSRVISLPYNRKPFKLLELETAPGYLKNVVAPINMMTIYNKGLNHVLNKYYGCEYGKDMIITTDDYDGEEIKDMIKIKNVKGRGVGEYETVIYVSDRKLIPTAVSIIYIIDSFEVTRDLVKDSGVIMDVEAHGLFTTYLVGKSIFHNTCPETDLESTLLRQEEFISNYMLHSVKEEFKLIGKFYEDIYDFYVDVFIDYDSILNANIIKGKDNIEVKTLKTLQYLFADVFYSVNKELEYAYEMVTKGKHDTAISKLSKTIKKNVFRSIASTRALSVGWFGSMNDILPYSVGTETGIQEIAEGNSKKTGGGMSKGLKELKGLHALMGSIPDISNNKLSPLQTHNPYCLYDEGGNPIFNKALLARIDKGLANLTSIDPQISKPMLANIEKRDKEDRERVAKLFGNTED